MNDVLDVILRGRPDAPERVAFVTLPSARLTVRVRIAHRATVTRWTCDACGRLLSPACPHAAAVAALMIGESNG